MCTGVHSDTNDALGAAAVTQREEEDLEPAILEQEDKPLAFLMISFN